MPAALAITSPTFYAWDPGGFFGGIWSFLSGVAGAVKDFVFEVVSKALDLAFGAINALDDVYHAVTNALTGGFDWLTQNAVNAANAVAGVVTQTYNMLDDAFSNLRAQLKSMLEHAWDDLKAWVLDPAGDFLKGVLGEGWDIVKKLIGLGIDGVNFLISLALDPFGTIWGLIEQAVKDIVGVVVPPFEWIVQTGLDILFAGFGDVVAVIKGAWHFLVWVAEHAADLTEEALTASFGLGASVFDDQVVNTLEARSADLEGIVAKWFG